MTSDEVLVAFGSGTLLTFGVLLMAAALGVIPWEALVLTPLGVMAGLGAIHQGRTAAPSTDRGVVREVGWLLWIAVAIVAGWVAGGAVMEAGAG